MKIKMDNTSMAVLWMGTNGIRNVLKNEWDNKNKASGTLKITASLFARRDFYLYHLNIIAKANIPTNYGINFKTCKSKIVHWLMLLRYYCFTRPQEIFKPKKDGGVAFF